jgi:hypothetical protein
MENYEKYDKPVFEIVDSPTFNAKGDLWEIGTIVVLSENPKINPHMKPLNQLAWKVYTDYMDAIDKGAKEQALELKGNYTPALRFTKQDDKLTVNDGEGIILNGKKESEQKLYGRKNDIPDEMAGIVIKSSKQDTSIIRPRR